MVLYLSRREWYRELSILLLLLLLLLLPFTGLRCWGFSDAITTVQFDDLLVPPGSPTPSR